MASNQYIEFNSTYRNREIWTQPAEFQIPLEMSGLENTKQTAQDPVSYSAPLFAWTSNRLDALISASTAIIVTPRTYDITNPIGALTTNVTIIEQVDGNAQQLVNYYAGLVIDFPTPPNAFVRRIDVEKYYGVATTGEDLLFIGMVNPMSDSYLSAPLASNIQDPSDFSNTSYPFLFVPNGSNYPNAYNQYIIYNETINEYRPISLYNEVSHILQIDTTGTTTSTSGPLTNWNTTDNFSLRRAPPLIPTLGATAGFIPYIVPSVTDALGNIYDTSLSQIVVFDPSATISAVANDYKNDFLRILPFGSDASATDRAYVYAPTPTIDQSRRITSYVQVLSGGRYYGVFGVATPYDTTLDHLYDVVSNEGAYCEVLPFSYDNFGPLSYNGSLVSQQENVCYEIQLHSITLPNAQLSVSNGGRLVNYPYIYVQLSNVSSSTSASQTIYTNNPNGWSALFRCTIFDINVPQITPFVRVDGTGMVITAKFKPNDNLYLKVTLPDGSIFNTTLTERYAPYAPNVFNQISALFRIKRLN